MSSSYPAMSLCGLLLLATKTSCGAFISPTSLDTRVRLGPAAMLSCGRWSATESRSARPCPARSVQSLSLGPLAHSHCANIGMQTQRRCSTGLQARTSREAASENSDDAGNARDLSTLRRNILMAVWLVFIVYAFGPLVPGRVDDPATLDLIKSLYDGSGQGNQIFGAIFNGLGLLPATYASILCGGNAFRNGRQSIPAAPLIFASFGLGFFALGPYLAFRNYQPAGDAQEKRFLEKVLTSKFTALSLLAGALWCVYTGVLAALDPASQREYLRLFSSMNLVHVSSIDMLILNVAIVDPIREDMRRRGWTPEPAKVALFALPLIGPALWLAVRPPVQD